MMDMAEFDFNIGQGEFTDNDSVTLVYDNESYTVPAIISKKYARKEVDGRFTTDLPTFTLTVIIAESQMPSSITFEDYRFLTVVVGGISYAVRYVTGTGMISLTLKPMDASDVTEGNDSGDDEIA